jgi:hypothetical protein
LCLNRNDQKIFFFSVPVWDVTFTHAQVISRGWMCNDILFLNLSFFYPKYVIFFGVKWLHPVGNWNGVFVCWQWSTKLILCTLPACQQTSAIVW